MLEMIPYEPRMGVGFVTYEVIEWLLEQRAMVTKYSRPQGGTDTNNQDATLGQPKEP